MNAGYLLDIETLEWVLHRFSEELATLKLPPVEMTLIGGSAMALLDLRNLSYDIDVFSNDRAQLGMAVTNTIEAYKQHFNRDLEFDVTDSDYIWGSFRVPDIGKMPVYKQYGDRLTVRGLDAETLFIIKTEAMRDKDIADLPLIAKKTTPEKIMARFKDLAQHQEPRTVRPIVDNLLSELQAQYLTEIKPAWVQGLSIGMPMLKSVEDYAVDPDPDGP